MKQLIPSLTMVGHSRKHLAISEYETHIRNIRYSHGPVMIRILRRGGFNGTSVPTGGLPEEQGLYGATSVASIRTQAQYAIVTDKCGRTFPSLPHCSNAFSLLPHAETMISLHLLLPLSPGCQRPSRYRLHRPPALRAGFPIALVKLRQYC